MNYPGYNIYQSLPDGVFEVQKSEMPISTKEDKIYVECAPKKIDGVWTQQYELITLSSVPLNSIPEGFSWDEESKTLYPNNPLTKAKQ